MKFCIFFRGVHPHLWLVWLALSFWGDVVTESDDCANQIQIHNTTSFIGKTTRVITGETVVSCVVHISNWHVQSNGLFYNVLLHELGHCHGLVDFSQSPDDIMSYRVLIHNDVVVQDVRFVGMYNRFIPISPSERYNFTDGFYGYFRVLDE